ncbi:protein TIC [Salix suchowensis]|nr:protein TIC [Salix suchowensis]
MAGDNSADQTTDSPDLNPQEDPNADANKDNSLSFSSDSDSDSDSDYDYDYDYTQSSTNQEDGVVTYTRPGDEIPESENTPEKNIARFTEVLESKTMKRMKEEEDRDYVFYEDMFDFPRDRENWREEDLKELWADPPWESTKPGWDPVWADEEDWDIVRKMKEEGRDPPIAPFYVPYRRPYPVIPDNHYDISNPKAVIEELDRIEEFLTWVSYIFEDGSSYEGTVWDDLAHGKGVYVAEQGLVRYEGEWLRNNMEGHGVVEVDIPDIEPIPGSKLEEKMRAEGRIISRDFMSPEDRKWLEMDIEDSVRLAGGQYEIPFYENDEWIRQFGEKPEKGRYRYAGEWKHGRMHGCGVYEVNERTMFGRFYFGEFVEDAVDCDEDISAVHAGIAEVAAAKARMFVNKPDGMVREAFGPYSDPQHPYFYEEEDVWMAPGFINQFYEVPDYWKRYVHEVDQEREMWLNSFYKAPLRLPMPAELSYWWENEETPEFIVLDKEPEPDPEDPSRRIYTEDPVILHTPTGRIIDMAEDEEHGVRLFWQPALKDGEDFDPDKVQFLPLGFDEFYGKEEVIKKENMVQQLLKRVDNVCKLARGKLEKWTEEKKKASEIKIQLYEKELELIEAELCLEETMEDLDEELKMREKEEEEKVETGLQEEENTFGSAQHEEKPLAKDDDDDEEEEEEEEDVTPSSFGSVTQDEDPTKNDQKGNRPGGAPFSASSLSFASCSLLSTVPSRLQQSFLVWKKRLPQMATPSLCVENPNDLSGMVNSVSFPPVLGQRGGRLRAESCADQRFQATNHSIGKMSQLHSLSRILSHRSASENPRENLKRPRKQRRPWLHAAPERDSDSILSLHTQLYRLESYTDTIEYEPLPPIN